MACFPYIGLVIALSVVVPKIPRAAGAQYCLYSIVGTLIYYIVCISLIKSKLLSWIETYSYPIFLLHEPVVGHLSGAILQSLNIQNSVAYVTFWVLLIFIATLILIFIIKSIHIDHWLWNFSLPIFPNVSQKATNKEG